MATRSRSFWIKAPSRELIPGITSYGERLREAVLQLAQFFAAKLEAAAKQGAPWRDRTGAARQGLRGFAIRTATAVVIYLVHGVNYGPHLELGTRFMAPRPIIMPTLEAHYADIMRAVRQLVGARA